MVQGAYSHGPMNAGLGSYEWAGGYQAKLAADNGLGWILRQLMGPATSTLVSTADAFQHVFVSSGGIGYTVGTLAFLLSRSNRLKQFNYLGGVVTRLGIEAVINQDIRYSPEFAGDQDEFDASPDDPPSPLHAAEFFRHHDSSFEVESAPDLDVEAWNLTIESNAMIVGNIETRFGRRDWRGAYTVSGRVDRDFVDALYYERVYGDDAATSPADVLTQKAVDIKIVGEIIEETFPYELNIILPAVEFHTIESNVSGGDRVVAGSPFVVLHDKADVEMFTLELQNKVTTGKYDT